MHLNLLNNNIICYIYVLLYFRATTVYMVEQAFHMLPITLCDLCSLNPGEDKLTISVIMTISKDGNFFFLNYLFFFCIIVLVK